MHSLDAVCFEFNSMSIATSCRYLHAMTTCKRLRDEKPNKAGTKESLIVPTSSGAVNDCGELPRPFALSRSPISSSAPGEAIN